MMNKLFLCFLLLFLTGCSKSQQTTTEKPVQAKENVYKIAVVAPQFGPYQALGLSIVHGAELAVDDKNEKGGIGGKKIQLIKIDDGGLASEGTWRAHSLVDQMVLGVIGHLNSDISIPASEIYSKAMISEISPGSTSPFFTERKPVRGYVFRTVGRDDQQGDIAAKFILEEGFKKIAVLYNNRSYGLSLSSEFAKKINALEGVSIVFQSMYSVGNEDFVEDIASLKEKAPDIVFFVGEYGDAAKCLTQMKKLGVEVAFLGSEGVFDQEFISSANSVSEGAFVVSLPTVTNKQFVEEYKKKFNKELGSYSANSFDAANILISAIEKVRKEDPALIAKAIGETKNYPGLSGNITFDLKGDLVNPNFSVYQVKGSMFVAVR